MEGGTSFERSLFALVCAVDARIELPIAVERVEAPIADERVDDVDDLDDDADGAVDDDDDDVDVEDVDVPAPVLNPDVFATVGFLDILVDFT